MTGVATNRQNSTMRGLRCWISDFGFRALTWPTLALACAVPVSAALSPTETARIEQAIPRKAPAQPAKPRRLLIFDLNVNYGGHGSIPFANHAFARMGQVTGAFATEVSHDPEVFRPDHLARFDAVFLNNNVGNLFTDPELRDSLAEFVWRGGGLMGVHGTTVAFTQWPGAIEDWPEFALMIGARGANHRENKEHVFIKLDDPDHPVNAVFGGQGWDYRDEFFRVHEPYSRDRLRVLFSIDTTKTDLQQGRGFGQLERADNDFALAWVKPHGRGRVFYCTIAHHPEVFQDPRMLEFYLAATQFVLGDLEGSVRPSNPRRFKGEAPAENLLWWLNQTLPMMDQPFTRSVQQAASLGQYFVGAAGTQPVSDTIQEPFGPGLSMAGRRAVRMALAEAGIRLSVYVPGDLRTAEDCEAEMRFARRMGALSVAVPSNHMQGGLLKRLASELDLELVHTDDPAGNVAERN
jgi:type 1 glutamine amidotransferase